MELERFFVVPAKHALRNQFHLGSSCNILGRTGYFMGDEKARQERPHLLARHLLIEHGRSRCEGLMKEPAVPSRGRKSAPEAGTVLRLLGE